MRSSMDPIPIASCHVMSWRGVVHTFRSSDSLQSLAPDGNNNTTAAAATADDELKLEVRWKWGDGRGG